MSAEIGNKYWLERSVDGRSKKFSSPSELWEAANEYFDWRDRNSWHKNEAIKSGDFAGTLIQVPTQAPYTLKGLAVYLGMTLQGILNYGEAKGYEDFFDVFTRIREKIEDQKFQGATVGVFNANIIARDLGLTDKSEVDQNITATVNIPPKQWAK